ncbi:MATE family efflux transporter [Anoxybacillus flavithermus]|uniref:MATE family efflux transporter n=1 Tax=Anoxybacillus flavithermus TaxID=33934 RepID=UPI0002F08F39
MAKKLSLFALTWPIFIELTLHMLTGNADTFMLSQYADEAVAAVGVANQLLFMVVVMFGFIATGTSILIAQYAGANDEKAASYIGAASIWANLLFGIVLSVVLWIGSDHLLQWMNVPNELMADARTYLRIVGGFSFVQALIMTLGAILRSYGFTRDMMNVTIGVNILNIIGNYFVLFGPFDLPVLGVAGVAWSTTISRIIGVVVGCFVLIKRLPHPLPLWTKEALSFTYVKQLLKIGIPSAGEHVAYNTSQLVITYFITMLGTEALTTRVYTQNIMMFIFLFSVAIGQGTQIMIGHLVGAERFHEAYTRCLRSLRLAVMISFSVAALFSVFSDQLFSIFTSNTRMIETGGTLIFLTMLLEPGRSFNLVIINSLRAAGDVKFPVYIGIASMWGVSVPLAYMLGISFDLGLVGIWLAFTADEWLRGLLVYWRWKSNVWRTKSFVKKEATA